MMTATVDVRIVGLAERICRQRDQRGPEVFAVPVERVLGVLGEGGIELIDLAGESARDGFQKRLDRFDDVFPSSADSGCGVRPFPPRSLTLRPTCAANVDLRENRVKPLVPADGNKTRKIAGTPPFRPVLFVIEPHRLVQFFKETRQGRLHAVPIWNEGAPSGSS